MEYEIAPKTEFPLRDPMCRIMLVLAFLLTAGCSPDAETRSLQTGIAELRKTVGRMESENQAMRQKIREGTGTDPYLVVDTGANRLYLRQGDAVVLTAAVSTGSGKLLEETGGRKWIFNTPKGVFSVLSKEENPIWYKPDWAFVEDNLPVPPPDSSQRFVRGMLGKYAIGIGGGYKIHGTPHTKLLGQAVSHGCIRIGNSEMEIVYHLVKVGTRVYIY